MSKTAARRGAAGAVVALALGAGTAMALSLRVGATHGQAHPTADTIVVDAAAPIRTLPPTFFGVNYVGFWDPDQGSAASARALAQTPIRLVRFPGGAPGDWYDWQDPYYKGWSSTSPLGLWRYAQRFGAAAMFQTNVQGHLPSPPGRRYAVNSPDNAAAYVRYLDAHGVAAVMEVGNEEDMAMHTFHDSSFQPYIDTFNRQARAMHQVNRHAMVLGPAGTNEYYWWTLDSLGMFLRQTGNRYGSGQVDGVSLHFYKGTTWDDSKGVAQYWLSSGGPWAAIQRAIHANDTRALLVDISEWNVGGSDTSGKGFNPTLAHALVTADMLGAFAQSGVAAEQYFDIHGAGTWGLLAGAGEGVPADRPTPTYYATALWGHMGRTLLRLTETADPSTMVSVYATRGAGGSVQVMAINKTSSSQTVHVRLTHGSTRARTLRVYELRGRSSALTDTTVSYDGAAMPPPAAPLPGPRARGRVAGNTVTYRLAPYSIAVLDIGR